MSTVWFITGSSRRPGQLLRQNQESGVGRMKNFMKTTRLVLAIMTLFAGHTNAGTQEQLAAYRQQIDSLDQRIIIDMSLWDVFKEPADERLQGRSLLSYFTELDRGDVRLGVAGKIMSAADARDCVDAGVDFLLKG